MQLGSSVIKRKREVEQAALLSAIVLLSQLAVFTGSERRARGATMILYDQAKKAARHGL